MGLGIVLLIRKRKLRGRRRRVHSHASIANRGGKARESSGLQDLGLVGTCGESARCALGPQGPIQATHSTATGSCRRSAEHAMSSHVNLMSCTSGLRKTRVKLPNIRK